MSAYYVEWVHLYSFVRARARVCVFSINVVIRFQHNRVRNI